MCKQIDCDINYGSGVTFKVFLTRESVELYIHEPKPRDNLCNVDNVTYSKIPKNLINVPIYV